MPDMPFPLNRRLTDSEKSRIVNMLATDVPPRKIAEETGCSYHTVMRVKRNLKNHNNHTPPITVKQGRPRKLTNEVLEVRRPFSIAVVVFLKKFWEASRTKVG